MFLLLTYKEILRNQGIVRPNSQKTIMIITDGLSNRGDPIPLAKDLINQNIEIVVFGI